MELGLLGVLSGALTVQPAANPAPRTESAAELHYEAPPSCPGPASVHARLSEIAADAALFVRIQAAGAGAWEVRIAVDGWEQARMMQAPACESVVEAVVLLIEMAVAAPPPASVDPPPQLRARTTLPGPKQPSSPIRRQPEFTLRLLAGGHVGSLPVVGGGGGIGLALQWKWIALRVSGSYWSHAPRARRGSRPTVDVGLGIATVEGCPLLRRRTIILDGCVAVELGAMQARGVGVIDAFVVRRPWVGIRLGTGLTWVPRPRFGVGAAMWTSLPLLRPTFYGERSDRDRVWLFSPRRAGFTFVATLELRWPAKARARKPRIPELPGNQAGET